MSGFQRMQPPRPVFGGRPPMPVVPLERVGRSPVTGRVMPLLKDVLARYRLVCQQQPERAGRPAIMVMPRLKPLPSVEPDLALLAIAESVGSAFGFTVNDLVSERRTGPMIPARQAMFWLARELTRHSLPAIGRAYNRDHSTVHHGVRACESLMAADPVYRATVHGLRDSLCRYRDMPCGTGAALRRHLRRSD